MKQASRVIMINWPPKKEATTQSSFLSDGYFFRRLPGSRMIRLRERAERGGFIQNDRKSDDRQSNGRREACARKLSFPRIKFNPVNGMTDVRGMHGFADLYGDLKRFSRLNGFRRFNHRCMFWVLISMNRAERFRGLRDTPKEHPGYRDHYPDSCAHHHLSLLSMRFRLFRTRFVHILHAFLSHLGSLFNVLVRTYTHPL
jgi:hypothetical protein